MVKMLTWWVSLSSRAPVSRSDPRTDVQSSKGRFEVMMVEPRSQRCEKASKSSAAAVGNKSKTAKGDVSQIPAKTAEPSKVRKEARDEPALAGGLPER